MMRSNVAKRRAREAAAAVASPSIAPAWTFDEDEDDFFGAKMPSSRGDNGAADTGGDGDGKAGGKASKKASKTTATKKIPRKSKAGEGGGKASRKSGGANAAGDDSAMATDNDGGMNVDQMMDEIMDEA
jgi:DNA helicase INO80